MTDGLNGGNWTMVNELVDTGSNFGAGGTACASGINLALKLTNDDNRPARNQASQTYLYTGEVTVLVRMAWNIRRCA